MAGLLWLRRLCQRGEHHHHAAAFEHGVGFHLGDFLQLLKHPVQHLPPVLRVRHLASPEHHGELDLVPLFEEPAGVAHLEVEVVLLDPRAHLHFLQLHVVLLLARLARLTLLLVLELAVVHDAADRRPGKRRDLHEVQPLLFRDLHRPFDRQNSDLLAVRRDHADGADPDLPVHTHLLVDTPLSGFSGWYQTKKRRT